MKISLPTTRQLAAKTLITTTSPNNHGGVVAGLCMVTPTSALADADSPREYSSSSTASSVTSSSSSSSNNESSSSSSTTMATSVLSSKRGRMAVNLLPSYLADARAVQVYNKDTCPHGALQLGVAETKLMQDDWTVPALNTFPTSITSDAIYYQPTAGRTDLKEAFASYIEDLCDLPSSSLQLDGLVVGAGCNAVLENLCFTLTEAGDAVLIPTPYYAAFEFDLVARAGLTVQAVHTVEFQSDLATSSVDPVLYYPSAAALDAAYEKAQTNGHPPKILLLSHPMNPLGICYPPHVIEECIRWCRENEVHLISDEIYAGSVYRPSEANFSSALKLAAGGGELGPFVHWVYALSKDFGLSGLRVGAAYTENPEIIVPLQKLNDLCQISSTTQIWTANMMMTPHPQQDHSDNNHNNPNPQQGSADADDRWYKAFRNENYKRLDARCRELTNVLEECGIPYMPPTSGLFVWMDFSKYLPSEGTDAQRERALYLEMVREFGLLFTPANSMRNESPGFFRCVFTAATDEEFTLALKRLRHFAKTKAAAAGR